jgi:flagellar protein FlbT
MSNLVLELRQGETMIVNGAPIRFRTKCRIELTGRARFLFGKQIMPPDQAHTPARRIYFALQTAYIGTEEERPQGLHAARALVAEFQASTTSALAREILDRAMVAAEADDCFAALKLVRRIVQHEDAVLARAAPAAGAATHPAAKHLGNAAPPRIVPPPAAITETA